MVKKLYILLQQFGFNGKQFINSLKGLPSFLKDYILISQQIKKQIDFKKLSIYPCLFDKFDDAGTMSGHYFHQDLYVAQKIFKNNPEKHLDIGSRIDGFVAHVACFRKIEILDIRNVESKIENIVFQQNDLMSKTFSLENLADSISCLHAIEHFGLGRYGDSINIDGHKIGLKNIVRCLKTHGIFYFSTPIGTQRIEFNAHRVFDIVYLLKLFEELNLVLEVFSYVDDKGDLYENVSILDFERIKNNFGCQYGCGIFILKKVK